MPQDIAQASAAATMLSMDSVNKANGRWRISIVMFGM